MDSKSFLAPIKSVKIILKTWNIVKNSNSNKKNNRVSNNRWSINDVNRPQLFIYVKTFHGFFTNPWFLTKFNFWLNFFSYACWDTNLLKPEIKDGVMVSTSNVALIFLWTFFLSIFYLFFFYISLFFFGDFFFFGNFQSLFKNPLHNLVKFSS